MSKRLLATSTLVVGVLVCVAIAGDEPGEPPKSPDDGQGNTPATAEVEIRQAAADFATAFNRGDAKAVAAHWTEDGDYVDEYGQPFHGREAIAEQYKKFFTTYPGVKIKLQIDSLRTIDEDNAIEDGHATLDPRPQGMPLQSRYTALHTKHNGQWLMTAVRDSRVEIPAKPGRLEDLDFLVGTWSVDQDGTRLEATCRWINNKNHLERWYTVRKGDQLLTHGRQMIGWDPLAGRIVSWTFTSEGGFAAGAWAPNENDWTVATVGVMRDGTLTSSTEVWAQTGEDSMSWKSVNRAKGDTALPDLQEVALKRKK